MQTSGISNLGAALAYQIGELGTSNLGGVGYVAAHAALDCASSAALGTGCSGGAIGAASSAMFANEIAKSVTGGQGATDPAQVAIISVGTQLLSGVIAGLVGADANAAALAAQSETVNNACGSKHGCGQIGAAAGAAVGGGAAAAGSVAIDAATGGINIIATPAEVAAFAALGGMLGGALGAAIDRLDAMMSSSGEGKSETKTPNVGDPGSWYTNPGSGQQRQYGNDGFPITDIDTDHDHGQGNPHSHNWEPNPNGGFPSRGPGVPVSNWPPIVVP